MAFLKDLMLEIQLEWEHLYPYSVIEMVFDSAIETAFDSAIEKAFDSAID